MQSRKWDKRTGQMKKAFTKVIAQDCLKIHKFRIYFKKTEYVYFFLTVNILENIFNV